MTTKKLGKDGSEITKSGKTKREIALANLAKKGPPGRPKGVKNKLTLLREAVKEEAEEIILSNLTSIVNKACEMAEKGDVSAMRLVLDRILPTHKALDATQSKKIQGITINISGQQPITIGGTEEETIIEGEYEDG